jgi:hypothetical protein
MGTTITPGVRVIYRAWITDKNGKRVYPKNGRRAFRLEVPEVPEVRPKFKD